jgi:type I restriction enzyme S subunit
MYFIYFGTIADRFSRHYTGTTIKHLTGASLSQVHFPLPPLNEQHRIVSKIEELFSDLDAGIAALKRAKANLKRYRAADLKFAVEGKLTEEWRAKHPHAEPASKLLARILTERRQKWESDQLAKFNAAGKEPPKGWKEIYVEPTPPDTTDLPELPESWCWVCVEQLAKGSLPGWQGFDYVDVGIPFVRSQNIRWDQLS